MQLRQLLKFGALDPSLMSASVSDSKCTCLFLAGSCLRQVIWAFPMISKRTLDFLEKLPGSR